MQTHLIVVESQKGNSKKTGAPYHVILTLGQNEEREIGVIKVFLKPHEIGNKIWDELRPGSVLSAELEQNARGFNSFVEVKSVVPAPNVQAELNFVE